MKRFWHSVCLGFCLALLLGWWGGAGGQPAPSLAFSGSTFAQLSDNAQQRYEAGQYDQAVELLWDAKRQAERSGDRLGVVLALRNLALIRTDLGEWAAAASDLNSAAALVAQLPKGQQGEQRAAIAELRGQWYFRQGQDEAALQQWQAATAQYTALENLLGVTRNQLNQANVLRYLGLYYRAAQQLTQLHTDLAAQPDTLLKAQALKQLGDVQRVAGKLTAAATTLTESAAIAAHLQHPNLQASILISLGHTAQACTEEAPACDLQPALDYYQQAADQAQTLELRRTAQLNQLHWWVEQSTQDDPVAGALDQAKTIWQTLEAQFPATLGGDRQTLYHQIQLVDAALKQSQLQSAHPLAQRLAQTIQAAEALGETKLQAFAFKSLGALYEQHHDFAAAQTATERSLQLAQAVRAPELGYQVQYQLGRIFRAHQQDDAAMNAYSQAIATLGSIRGDLVAMSSDAQFSFREDVEDIYRDYVDLLLQPGASQENLEKARSAIEALQLAELDNFFRDACLNAQERQIDEIDPHSAILYTIILEDRLEVVSALPGQPLTHHATAVPRAEIENTLQEYRKYLTMPRWRPHYEHQGRPIASELYRWLLDDTLIAQLQDAETETLVFVLDVGMGNIPLSALYDKVHEQYLIEQYAIALAPSLNLIDPQPLTTQNLNLLLGGLTEARPGFNPLPNVAVELREIQETGVKASLLLDPTFTKPRVKTMVHEEAFPVVHFATHGKFSSRSEDTFILTWDDQLNIDELNALLRTDSKQTTPIELLVLSACQTAKGDPRAALGLAGVAVRAGARSTLAGLWTVDDQATAQLIVSFYKPLINNPIHKAEALRQAQLSMLRGESRKLHHPYYWSAFVLVGNWL